MTLRPRARGAADAAPTTPQEPPAETLEEVVARLDRASGGLVETRAAEEAAEASTQQALTTLAADFGLGRLDADEYEERKRALAEELEQARAARERAEIIVDALSTRAADVAERDKRQIVTTLETHEAALTREIDRLRAEAAQLQARRERIGERLRVARHELARSRWPFDKSLAGTAAQIRTQERGVVDWYAKNISRIAEAPVHLHPEIRAERARLEQQAREEEAAFREHAISAHEGQPLPTRRLRP